MQGTGRKPHKPRKPLEPLSPHTSFKRRRAKINAFARSAVSKANNKLPPDQKKSVAKADAERMAQVVIGMQMTPRNKTQLRSAEYSKLINNGAKLGTVKAELLWLELQKHRSP